MIPASRKTRRSVASSPGPPTAVRLDKFRASVLRVRRAALGAGIASLPNDQPSLHAVIDRVAKTEGDVRQALRLPVQTLPQPDETTCGPTCLHAVYRYWGDTEPLDTIIARMYRLERGGTFAVFLGCDALRKGYCATIYTYNVTVFDPTWFTRGVDIAGRLVRQREIKQEERLQIATSGYLEFLDLGGRLRFADLSQVLVRALLRVRLPILTGLSSTYLYRSPREYGPHDTPDDIQGYPAGHFVVIAGFDRARRRVLVVDPYQPNPYGTSHEYWLSIDRVVAAILLGIVTHDANLLVVYPRRKPAQRLS